MTAGFVQDPAGNQFSLTSGIGGNDDLRDIFPEKLCLYIMVLFGYVLSPDGSKEMGARRDQTNIQTIP